MNIYLIGYRGSGKTSVGRILAAKLKRRFIDADGLLAELHGQTITEMVKDRGWEVFRRREKEILQHICMFDNCVIATGGGAVLDPQNVTRMKAGGKLVWLRATPETIRRRIQQDAHSADLRPSLTANGQIDEIEDVLTGREPHYQKAMDISVDTDGKTIESIADEVIHKSEINQCQVHSERY